MVAATLWIEIIIAGFPFFVAIFFVALTALGITDLRGLTPDKDSLPYISAIAIAASYVAGTVALRLVQISSGVGRYLRRARRRELTNGALLPLIDDSVPLHSSMIAVWQHGSERLNREIDFQYSLFALFASLLASLLFLGGSLTIWLARSTYPWPWLPLFGAVLLVLPVLVAFLRQRQVVRRIRGAALAHLSELQKGTGSLARTVPSSSEGGDPDPTIQPANDSLQSDGPSASLQDNR